jgi:hypothetical protein
MNRRKENKLSMYLTVLAWYELNKTAADALPKVLTIMAAINANVLKIDQINQALQADPTGVAKLKQETRDKLEIAAMDVVVKLIAYFAVEGDTINEEAINFSLRDFRNAADTLLKERCSLVAEIATATLPSMDADYGLTPDMITLLSDLAQTYFGLIPMPRLKTVERKIKKEEMDATFRLVDKDLLLLTKIISIVRFSNPDLYNSFMAAKTIIDYKGKSKNPEIVTGIEGVVTDFETEQPMPGVKVEANTTDKTVLTDEDGYYKLPLAAGTSIVSYAYVGYLTHSETVEIEEGILYDNDVDMEKPEEG